MELLWWESSEYIYIEKQLLILYRPVPSKFFTPQLHLLLALFTNLIPVGSRSRVKQALLSLSTIAVPPAATSAQILDALNPLSTTAACPPSVASSWGP